MKIVSRKAAKKAPKLKVIAGRATDKDAVAVIAAKRLAQSEEAGELSPLQQEALIIKYRIKARKLGRSILRRWHSRMDLDEVDSIVDLSLCEAVKRFNPDKGASFMTFLFYNLKGNLVRAVASAAASSSLPVRLADMGEVFVDESEAHTSNTQSINAAEIAEAVTSQDAPLPDEALWRKQLTDCSSLACEKLDALEREIIKRIFVHEQQIIDIATALGYSRCHISRVKKKALDTLHDELSMVMNRDDYARLTQEESEDSDTIRERISGRKEIHRRRPRANTRHEAEVAPAQAA
jgi:RNA polymerase sigma factor (sigma-70 family)